MRAGILPAGPGIFNWSIGQPDWEAWSRSREGVKRAANRLGGPVGHAAEGRRRLPPLPAAQKYLSFRIQGHCFVTSVLWSVEFCADAHTLGPLKVGVLGRPVRNVQLRGLEPPTTMPRLSRKASAPVVKTVRSTG